MLTVHSHVGEPEQKLLIYQKLDKSTNNLTRYFLKGYVNTAKVDQRQRSTRDPCTQGRPK